MNAYRFTDSQIALWIQNAIRDYSINWPLMKRITIEAGVGESVYDLAYDVHFIRHVYYVPDNDFSRGVYLKRSNYTADDFTLQVNVYDWIKRTHSQEKSTLLVSPPSETAQDLYYVDYGGDHIVPEADLTNLTVADRHLQLLLLYIRWKATEDISTVQNVAIIPRVGTLVSPPMSEEAARMAMNAYFTAVKQAKREESEGVTVRWKMDKWE
jgi:hypothetical protein